MRQFTRRVIALSAFAALAACGGGGSDSPPSPTPTVKLDGVAASNVALSGATVSVKCAAGTGTATTANNGTYTVTLSSASLPCVLKVAGSGSSLHSMLPGTGTSGTYTVNLSPLTELVVAKATGIAPEAFFTGFTAATAPTAAVVTQATEAVKTLAAGVVDLSGVNPISDTLVPSTSTTAGNAQAQKIETLVSALATAQTTLDTLVTAVVDNPTATDPIKTVLQPSASTCAWLRSGRFRLINAAETDPAWRAHVIELDATTLTVKAWDNSTTTLTDQGECKFTFEDSDQRGTLLVSSAGSIAVYSESKTTTDKSFALGMPEQSLPASALAGTWNTTFWGYEGAIATPGFLAELNGNGSINAPLDQFNTVTAVDATTKAVTRLRDSDSRVDTLGYDKPRNGLRYRVKNSCTINNVASNCSEVVQLPVQGMGITVTTSVGQTNAAAAFLNLSISRP